MPVERPTFSESWYRVEGICPRLRSAVQVHRQHFRGQAWRVVREPGSNDFFRLSESAYRFVALLDGRRTVADAWRLCNEELGDDAPTQGEVIQLLGQLYTSNLLMAELPPDAEQLLRRYRKRKTREVQSFLTNVLFIRIPLFDPDYFLDRWASVLGRVFTVWGLAAWLALMAAAAYFLTGKWGQLIERAQGANGILSPENLPWLYAAMVIAKVFHEFGHAFSVKWFGRTEGGGEVHAIGLMFLVFMPLPYVDASSAWAFRSKWRRAVVGAAGMLVELAIAAIAAIVWANTSGSTVGAVCYNIIFIAGVSTVLFNANPLLRYDGYYILSDLLEIPNLQQRAKQYLYYLVRRRAWGVKPLPDPAHTWGERFWFVVYGIASTIYRFVIFAAILLYLTERLPKALAVVAMGFGIVSAVAWALLPTVKFLHYLLTGTELARVRGRAIASSALAALAVAAGVGAIPAPDRIRVEGVVEPETLAFVYTQEDGFVTDALTSRPAVAAGTTLLRTENDDLKGESDALAAQARQAARQRAIATAAGKTAEARAAERELRWIARRAAWIHERIADLTVTAPLSAQWIAPDIDRFIGGYARRGQKVGLLADTRSLIVRAVVGQDDKRLVDDALREVDLRVRGRADLELSGSIKAVLPAGRKELPSVALGYAAGGTIRTNPHDAKGVQAAENVFQVLINPDPQSNVPLRAGQRITVRFHMPPKPLVQQAWLALRRLIEKRFRL